jgi:hypothetical protein
MITLITQLKLFIQLKNVNIYFNNCGYLTNKAVIFKNVLIKNKRSETTAESRKYIIIVSTRLILGILYKIIYY